MIRYIVFAFFMCSVVGLMAQQKGESSENLADCDGASNILTPGKYLLQFTGKPGKVNDIESYPSLTNNPETNSLWCLFVAPFNGRLSLDAKVKTGLTKMVIFTNETYDICGDIKRGVAEIQRMIMNPTGPELGLSLTVSDNYYYPLELVKGQNIMIMFNLEGPNTREKLEMNLKYEAIKDDPEVITSESKLVDQRIDINKSAFNIQVRDVETGDPVVADLVINGMKSVSSFYNGSDFLFNVERSGKFMIRCDAVGYFFVDREEPVMAWSEHELVIWLEPIGEGKSVQLDEIEFMPGTSEFLPSSEPKLRRLKDFLALNAGIRVEIQGHVQEKGDNSHAGQKVSEARAKRVMHYLIDNGIEKSRLEAKGYGNTRPIYPDPKFAYEEQANRRVEIKIL